MRYGWDGVEVEIVEDRGILTTDGKRFYTIKMTMEGEPVLDFPEELLAPLTEAGPVADPNGLQSRSPVTGRRPMSRRYSKHPPPRFRVGDRVRAKHGWEGGVFEITEDRGNIGVGGRRFYAIRATWADTDDQPFDFPEDSLEALPEAGAENSPAAHKS
jgi:hypothetical protein